MLLVFLYVFGGFFLSLAGAVFVSKVLSFCGRGDGGSPESDRLAYRELNPTSEEAVDRQVPALRRLTGTDPRSSSQNDAKAKDRHGIYSKHDTEPTIT
jgi:hypothetical protein